jgi:hypothetical protein
MTELRKINTRKILLILFFVSIFFEIIYFTCKPLLHVEFRYYSAIFYFVFVTLLSGVILVPQKKLFMWILYPLIAFVLLANTLLFLLVITSPDYTKSYLSPHHQRVLIIEEEHNMSEPYDITYSFYVVKAKIFKRKICKDVVSTENNLDLMNLVWIDDSTVKINYYTDPSDSKPKEGIILKLTRYYKQ